MAASSDQPLAPPAVNESTSAAQTDSETTHQAAEPETTNTAPVPKHPAPTATKTAAKAEDGPTEQKTDASHDDAHGVNPLDFTGSVDSNNELPTAETLRKIENYVVLDRDGKTHPFKSLYTGKHVARRVLIIFVRHFFCGVSFCFSLRNTEFRDTASLTCNRTAKNTSVRSQQL